MGALVGAGAEVDGVGVSSGGSVEAEVFGVSSEKNVTFTEVGPSVASDGNSFKVYDRRVSLKEPHLDTPVGSVGATDDQVDSAGVTTAVPPAPTSSARRAVRPVGDN